VVNFCCFDKTGTLTEDFMDFEALVPAEKGKFETTIENRKNKRINLQTEMEKRPYLVDVFNNMASNHSIIKIEETEELVGDPMEIKLFEFGEFTLNQGNSDPEVIFSFESTRNQTGQIYRRF
jgi:magnesium-transporting ATPase (P-type)